MEHLSEDWVCWSYCCPQNLQHPDLCLTSPRQPYDVTTISAPDGSITAKFASFGATLTELWVKDKNGEAIDVVPGYDDNVSLSLFLSLWIYVCDRKIEVLLTHTPLWRTLRM